MGTHLRALSKTYPINNNMTGFRWFQISLRPCSLDESNLNIGRADWVKRILLPCCFIQVRGSLGEDVFDFLNESWVLGHLGSYSN